MPIKALTLAEWIARLTKGYIKYTGKKPDGLAKLKIKLEAAQRVRDQSKVVEGNFNPKEEWWKARPTVKKDLSKYTDEDLNALVAEDKKILAEANELSGAGINYGRVQEIEARRKEIKKILEAAQAVPESGYGNIKADLALHKQKKPIKPDPAERLKAKKKDWRKDEDWDDKGPWDEPKKDPFKDEDWNDFASGGIAGELHLNDGGRVSFTKGGKVSSGLAHVLGV
jgi:hypothetical protein